MLTKGLGFRAIGLIRSIGLKLGFGKALAASSGLGFRVSRVYRDSGFLGNPKP